MYHLNLVELLSHDSIVTLMNLYLALRHQAQVHVDTAGGGGVGEETLFEKGVMRWVYEEHFQNKDAFEPSFKMLAQVCGVWGLRLRLCLCLRLRVYASVRLCARECTYIYIIYIYIYTYLYIHINTSMYACICIDIYVPIYIHIY